MNWSFLLGRPFGIEVRVHWLFVALLAFLLFFGGGLSSAVLVTCVFGFVVLHELGHSLVARRYGVGVRSITLLPIGGVAQLEGRPPTPTAELWIALAGPLVNIALAIILFPLAILAGTPRAGEGSGGLAFGLNALGSLSFLLAALVSINVGLALFNLLPAFPMDGGRVLRALLAKRVGMLEATRRAARVGRWLAALMAIAGVLLGRPMLLFIAAFVYVAGSQEEAAVRMSHAQAPTLQFDPIHGWHYRMPHGPLDAHRGFDHRHVEEALRRLMRALRERR